MTERRAQIDPEHLPDGSAEGGYLKLPEQVAHYVGNVLRMEPGDPLELFDGRGRLLECRIQQVRDDDVRVAILDDRESRRNESPRDVELFAAIPKGDRWRWILEKATELGISRIAPLVTRHSVVQVPDDRIERKMERWNRIVGEAARQCERTLVPAIEAPSSVDDALDAADAGLDVCLHARRDADPLADTLARRAETTDGPVRLWIGPEGGFAGSEVDQMSDRAVTFCHLGPRILRAETAAVAATALAQQIVGGLEHERTANS